MDKVFDSIVDQTFNSLAIKVHTDHIARLDALALEVAEQKKHIARLIASFDHQ
jgi:hypothetical protein